MSIIGRTILAALPAILTMGPAKAQMTSEVKFDPGNYGTMITGTITGRDYFDYHLGARAGQQLFVEMNVAATNGHGTVYVNVLPPGSTGEAIYVGSMDGDNYETISLPKNGTYTLRVYLMGNDYDAGKTVTYNLDVSIQ